MRRLALRALFTLSLEGRYAGSLEGFTLLALFTLSLEGRHERSFKENRSSPAS
jgi:hypothetical protein